MAVKLTEQSDGWDFIFDNGELRLLKIDFRIEFVISDASKNINLCVETRFSVIRGGIHSNCIPAEPETLAPILPFVNEIVESIKVDRSGNLSARFKSGAMIEVRPDPSYEAWQLGAPPDVLMVCPPEGQTVVFEKRDVS
jgi:Family of unknown function (DUF6188)